MDSTFFDVHFSYTLNERAGGICLQITVYMDVVFLIDAIVTLTSLFFTGKMLKKRIFWKKLLLATFFATISLFVFILFPFLFLDWKGMLLLLGVSIATVAIPYWECKLSFFRTWFYSTTIMMLQGSFMSYIKYISERFSLRISTWLLFFFVSTILVLVMLSVLRNTSKQCDNLILVKIIHGKQTAVETLYMDTGNCLIDPVFSKPVIVLNENLIRTCLSDEEKRIMEEYKKSGRLNYEKLLSCQSQKRICFHEISYRSVGKTSGKMLCLLIDEIKVLGSGKVLKKQPVAVAPAVLFDGTTYQGLLHKECI